MSHTQHFILSHSSPHFPPFFTTFVIEVIFVNSVNTFLSLAVLLFLNPLQAYSDSALHITRSQRIFVKPAHLNFSTL